MHHCGKAGSLSLFPKPSHPLQYSGLENSMDCIVHGVAKSWTQLSNFHFNVTKQFSRRTRGRPETEPLKAPKAPGRKAVRFPNTSLFFQTLNFLFCIGAWPINNAVGVSGEQWRDSAMQIHVSCLLQTPVPSGLSHNIEWNSTRCTIDPCCPTLPLYKAEG